MTDEKKRGDYPDRDPVIYRIKKAQATQLKVFLGDGTEKQVAVSKAGNRWHKLQEVLSSMPWERIEIVDAKGAVVDVVENEEGFEDDYEDEEEGGGKNDVKLARVMMSLMMKTLSESRKMFEAQMKGTSAVIDALISGLNEQREVHRLQIAAATAAAGGNEGEATEIVKLLAMGMMNGRPAAPPVPPPRVTPRITPSQKP